MSSKAKTLAVDFGNVCSRFSHARVIEGWARFSSLDSKTIKEMVFGEKDNIEARFQAGELDERGFYNAVCSKAKLNELTEEKFYEIFRRQFRVEEQNDELDKLLDEVDPRVALVVISNTNPVHWPLCAEFPIIRHFPEKLRILSYKIKRIKPHKDIYDEAVRLAECTFPEMVLVDDLIENIEGARNLGMQAIHYDCRTDSIEVLKDAFAEHGILGS